MTLLYTINWKKVDYQTKGNFSIIEITCLDRNGNVHKIQKQYEEWIGVCTNNIQSVVSRFKYYFPSSNIRYEKIQNNYNGKSLFTKVLPYFPDRLKTKNFIFQKHPFHKVYVDDCCIEEIGLFFREYEYAYFLSTDWLNRLYIDFASRYRTLEGFFYQWYYVCKDEPLLMDSFCMRKDMRKSFPKWKFAAFDIETVSPAHNVKKRIPNGMDPTDKIVMISIVKWQQDSEQEVSFLRKFVLYLNPTTTGDTLKSHLADLISDTTTSSNITYLEYDSEIDLLNDFHYIIRDSHILTGYNINKFDIPCIFARLLWLQQYSHLRHYSSFKLGKYLITTFLEKIVIDVFHYFQIFSDYDLSSFKLDIVAKTKLNENDAEGGKLAVDVVGIHYWYYGSGVNNKCVITKELCLSKDPAHCYEILKPQRISSPERFGTFPLYLEYCLRDSELVYKLFRKERILGFLTARANLGPFNVHQAMYLGNPNFLLEFFKTHGMMLGFFLNTDFLENRSDGSKYASTFVKNKYQGALNYCPGQERLVDVVELDFTSMYPTALLNANLCYSTCDIITAKEYSRLDDEVRQHLTVIPYRVHDSNKVFRDPTLLDSLSQGESSENAVVVRADSRFFRYPTFDAETDTFVIVINQRVKSFLPTLVEHLLDARKYHQEQWKLTRNVFHYNSQLCLKILINSIYGTMACNHSVLAYIPLAMAIANLGRYQLLGSYHYVLNLGYRVCYADTDSLMIQGWPYENCDILNRFLSTLSHVELKFEDRWKTFLMLGKKYYIYEKLNEENTFHMSGFPKRVNELTKYMLGKIIKTIIFLKNNHVEIEPSDGWILWVETLCEALFMCRDPQKYSISRKTKNLSDYVSTTCASVRMLQKYPEKQGEFIDFVYSRADVSEKGSQSWIMDIEECRYVNFEQLFMRSKTALIKLLNLTFWNLPKAKYACDRVLNTMRWKYFMHAELKYYFRSGGGNKKKIVLLMERGIKYIFNVNDFFNSGSGYRCKVVKRKKNIEMMEGVGSLKKQKKKLA